MFTDLFMSRKWRTDNLVKHTRFAAIDDDAGSPGSTYPEFKQLSLAEIDYMLALNIINGLAPKHNITDALRKETVGRGWMYAVPRLYTGVVANPTRRVKHFQRYFHVQNPRAVVDTADPLFKIRPALTLVNDRSMALWRPGEKLFWR